MLHTRGLSLFLRFLYCIAAFFCECSSWHCKHVNTTRVILYCRRLCHNHHEAELLTIIYLPVVKKPPTSVPVPCSTYFLVQSCANEYYEFWRWYEMWRESRSRSCDEFGEESDIIHLRCIVTGSTEYMTCMMYSCPWMWTVDIVDYVLQFIVYHITCHQRLYSNKIT